MWPKTVLTWQQRSDSQCFSASEPGALRSHVRTPSIEEDSRHILASNLKLPIWRPYVENKKAPQYGAPMRPNMAPQYGANLMAGFCLFVRLAGANRF